MCVWPSTDLIGKLSFRCGAFVFSASRRQPEHSGGANQAGQHAQKKTLNHKPALTCARSIGPFWERGRPLNPSCPSILLRCMLAQQLLNGLFRASHCRLWDHHAGELHRPEHLARQPQPSSSQHSSSVKHFPGDAQAQHSAHDREPQSNQPFTLTVRTPAVLKTVWGKKRLKPPIRFKYL